MDAASCDTVLDKVNSSTPSANPFRFQKVSPSPPAGQAPTPIGCLVFKELVSRFHQLAFSLLPYPLHFSASAERQDYREKKENCKAF
jgi:hypothetical protein